MSGQSGRGLLLVAGEASGDLYGARLLSELTRQRPDLEVFGLGGDELAAAGLELVGHCRDIAVVGLTEVLKVLPRARELFGELLAEVDRRGVRVAVLIDFPGFNLRLAKALKRRGVQVIYYVSPQVWAWGRGRVRSIARRVDKMLVLFDFERGFYRRHGVEVVHVGHPLVDEVPALDTETDEPRPADALRVALLPGSRRSEVEVLLPRMLTACGMLTARQPLRLLLIRAATVPRAFIDGIVEASEIAVEIVESDRFLHLSRADLALCASGTATLEVGLLGTPMIVVYRVGWWTSILGRLLIRLPYVSLVNLVLGDRVVPELLQGASHPRRIANEAARLLDDPAARAAVRGRLAELRRRLGEPGASRRAAREVLELLS